MSMRRLEMFCFHHGAAKHTSLQALEGFSSLEIIRRQARQHTSCPLRSVTGIVHLHGICLDRIDGPRAASWSAIRR